MLTAYLDLLPVATAPTRHLTVNSVHEQGIDRLGTGLSIEALASDDELIEAFSATPCGGDVLAVQWHPEWDAGRAPGSRAFFSLIGESLRRSVGVPAVSPAPARTSGALRGCPRG